MRFYFYEVPEVAIETESRVVISRGKGQWLLNGSRISGLKDEKILEISLTMMCIYLTILNGAFKCGSDGKQTHKTRTLPREGVPCKIKILCVIKLPMLAQ